MAAVWSWHTRWKCCPCSHWVWEAACVQLLAGYSPQTAAASGGCPDQSTESWTLPNTAWQGSEENTELAHMTSAPSAILEGSRATRNLRETQPFECYSLVTMPLPDRVLCVSCQTSRKLFHGLRWEREEHATDTEQTLGWVSTSSRFGCLLKNVASFFWKMAGSTPTAAQTPFS